MELIYKDLISDELKELEVSLLESISSDVDLATEISNYLLVSGGKRIRPSICILLAKVFNYEGNELIKLAASIELLHTATLIHDDVVDESLIRRGKESIHSKWDNAHGVLVGDFVYSKAFQLMASFEDQKIIRELANSTNRISEGEVLQLSFKQEVLEEKDYLEIVDRKTAELFKASAVTAAILSKCSKRELENVANFATALGIAFQIQDDILDYFGEEAATGKKVGKDFIEGKYTLPVNLEKKQKIIELLNEGQMESFSELLEILNAVNIQKEMKKIFGHYTDICLNALEKMPQNDFRKALENIVSHLDQRLT
jgi:octaprenyl-diphosphate synthase